MPDPRLIARLQSPAQRGASMEDVARLRDPDIATPAAALRALKAGNERFFGGRAVRPELNANERRAQIAAQTPFASVLGCSDSRVPVEIVFDQGLGDLFIVRVAGPVADAAVLGSLEYSLIHLKTRLVVVMGHEGCGAVDAALLPEADTECEPQHIRALLEHIRPAVRTGPELHEGKARMREAVVRHVLRQVSLLRANPVVAQAEASGRAAVVGAYYEIGSGAVDFYGDEALSADESC